MSVLAMPRACNGYVGVHDLHDIIEKEQLATGGFGAFLNHNAILSVENPAHIVEQQRRCSWNLHEMKKIISKFLVTKEGGTMTHLKLITEPPYNDLCNEERKGISNYKAQSRKDERHQRTNDSTLLQYSFMILAKSSISVLASLSFANRGCDVGRLATTQKRAK
jgi:hypothetical protein